MTGLAGVRGIGLLGGGLGVGLTLLGLLARAGRLTCLGLPRLRLLAGWGWWPGWPGAWPG
ncbi:hypothetical protein GA0115245_10812 [Streptomyces sp. di188]|nr:hypothetical protein GA0115245_10812 [Streptomyces sp. di188]